MLSATSRNLSRFAIALKNSRRTSFNDWYWVKIVGSKDELLQLDSQDAIIITGDSYYGDLKSLVGFRKMILCVCELQLV